MFRNQYFATTDVGLQRDNNEDAYLVSAKDGIWVVADGMGGHASGEVASEIVTKTILREVHSGQSLEKAIQKSHQDILSAANSGIGGHGMGSTVVALRSQGRQYEICWVGDSRAYLFAPDIQTQTSTLRQLTTDHSYVQMLYQSGAITAAELQTHPEKNIITQCLGSIELRDVAVDQLAGEWPERSLILLCSDGLTDVVSEEKIQSILEASGNLAYKTKRLIDTALEHGGKDNITVSLIKSPSAQQLWLQSVRDRLYLTN